MNSRHAIDEIDRRIDSKFWRTKIVTMLVAGVVKKEEELGSEAMLIENVHQYVLGDNNRNFNTNNDYKGISIAERRAATCGFNASNINSTDWFTATGVSAASQPIKSPYFTVPPGISPSALLDSPVMLHNDQVQLSPTTGTFQFTSTKPLVQGFVHPFSKGLIGENEVLAKNNCFIDSFAIFETFGNKSWSEAESLISQTNHFLTGDNGKERTKTQNREKQQKGMALAKDVAKYSDDGYYWRKYGQKQVKGSEYPRSYFKCTNTDCQVKKKVERSYEGEITEIVYKGSHNHPQPQTVKQFGDTTEINEGTRVKDEDQSVNEFSTFLKSFVSDFSSSSSQALEPVGTQERSPTFGSQGGDDKDKASRDSISVNADDGGYGECEPKRRRRNNETSSISRSNREPRVVVQIESEIDILDDGYRWRKYGQKVVKGNPNPRSYYKCTTPGCPVRKHVERAANDIKSVITTYEGKHNHEVPSSKNSTFLISDVASLPSNVANNTTTSTALKTIHLPKTGKETQTLPLHLQQKPMLSCSYNEFMMSNFPGHDLNFGASSNYPLSFPTFPYSSSLFLNGNDMKTFSTSDIYPMLPDYMPMPSQMNPVSLSTNLPPLMNTYPGIQPSIRGNEIYSECQPKILKRKQEQRDDIGVFDASCLYIPNQGHGTV